MAGLTEEMLEQIRGAVRAEIEKAIPREIEHKFIPTSRAAENLDPTGGFENFGDFVQKVYLAGAKGIIRPDLKQWIGKTAGYMEEGDMSQGGYLVPPQFVAMLLQTTLETSIVRARAMVIPMATNSLQIPCLVDSNHSTNYFGGVIIYRPGETEAKTPTKPALGLVTLTLHELAGLVHVTNALLEDSPISLPPILTALFGQAISFVEDTDYLQGNGANQALGAFNAANPSLIAVAKEAGQAATTIVTENILKMWARLHPVSQGRAVWIANSDCFPQLASMSLSVGVGGIPVFMPAGGVTGTPYATLMGRPLILSEKMQTLGTQGDIGLADFSQYIIGDKGGIQTATSIHLKFDYDETSFRFVMRNDGQPWWLSALTPRYSASTLSPFVVLAVRA